LTGIDRAAVGMVCAVVRLDECIGPDKRLYLWL
jgi:hypothetical protein